LGDSSAGADQSRVRLVALEVYDIANNQLTGAAPLGSVGLDWQLGGFSGDPPTGSIGSSGSTSQLGQAIASFGGGLRAADTPKSAPSGPRHRNSDRSRLAPIRCQQLPVRRSNCRVSSPPRRISVGWRRLQFRKTVLLRRELIPILRLSDLRLPNRGGRWI